jgi:hypothetical protein
MPMRTLVVSCVLVQYAAAPARAQTANDDRAAVVAVVQRLFDAMRTRDTAAMRAVFDSSARLVSVRPRRGGGSGISVTPWQLFAAANARDTARVWDERIYDPEVRLDATLATVWVAYDFYAGGTFSHCGYDAFQLLKGPDGWKIVSIADTFQREGCPRR